MQHIKSCFYYGKNELGKMISQLILLCFDTVTVEEVKDGDLEVIGCISIIYFVTKNND